MYNVIQRENEKPVALNLPTDETFLTTEEVLEYLNVNLRTVYRLIKAGSILISGSIVGGGTPWGRRR